MQTPFKGKPVYKNQVPLCQVESTRRHGLLKRPSNLIKARSSVLFNKSQVEQPQIHAQKLFRSTMSEQEEPILTSHILGPPFSVLLLLLLLLLLFFLFQNPRKPLF